MKVTFQVDMEYICRLARQMLWEENKDLEYCVRLVEDVLMHPDFDDEKRRRIAIEILEGKKIVKGINEGVLMQDGENIRPLTELVMRKERQIAYHKMIEDMEKRPFCYIDHAAGGYSLTRGVGDGRFGKIPWDIQMLNTKEIIMLRKYNVTNEEMIKADKKHIGILEAGTYLLTNTKFAFQILGGPVKKWDDATNKCTLYYHKLLKEWKEKGIQFEDMDGYQKDIHYRNAFVDKNFPYRETRMQEVLMKREEETLSEEREIVEEEMLDIPYNPGNEEYELAHWRFLQKKELNNKSDSRWYEYLGLPDEQEKPYDFYGWISPEGVYYSSGFGGHSLKSYAILMEMDAYRKEFYERYSLHEKYVEKKYPTDYDVAEIYLLRNGWVKLHDPSGSGMSLVGVQGKEIENIQYKKAEFVLKYHEINESIRIDCYFIDELEEKKGLTGWLLPNGEFITCKWGEHHMYSGANYRPEMDSEPIVKMGSENGEESYVFVSMGFLTDVQEKWFKENWTKLDEDQQNMMIEFLMRDNEEKNVGDLKSEYEECLQVFEPLFEQDRTEMLHDWIALGMKLKMKVNYSNDAEEINRLFTEWRFIGESLLKK